MKKSAQSAFVFFAFLHFHIPNMHYGSYLKVLFFSTWFSSNFNSILFLLHLTSISLMVLMDFSWCFCTGVQAFVCSFLIVQLVFVLYFLELVFERTVIFNLLFPSTRLYCSLFCFPLFLSFNLTITGSIVASLHFSYGATFSLAWYKYFP